jgi:CubicO group peptidase (beta-lactamase class C family)
MGLHDAMAARIDQGEFPGIITVVARGDRVRVDAIGTTEFGGDVPMRPELPFRVASLSKPILAAATLALAEDDVLDLEEPVHTLLPELTGQPVLARVDGPLDEVVPAQRPPTIEDLLTFRLGYGHITEPEFDPPWPIVEHARELDLELGAPYPRTHRDPDDWIRTFATLPLMDQPGSRWRYNVSALVLGVLVARAAKQPLGDVLRDRLFEPLGMRDTGFVLSPERAAELPPHYMADQATGKMAEEPDSDPQLWATPPVFPSGAGGLVSTVDDMLTFGRMLLNGGVHGGTRVLSERSVELMTTNRLTDEQVGTAGALLGGSGWGLGLAVTVTGDEVSGPGRYGWSGGSGVTWFNDPHEQLVAIAFTQVSDFLWNGGRAEFDKLAYGENV